MHRKVIVSCWDLPSVSEIGVGDHADLEVRFYARNIDVVVDRQLQLCQQIPPAACVVVDGDGVPAMRSGRAPGVELVGAFGLNTKIIPDKGLGGLCPFLFLGGSDDGVIPVQPFLQGDAEALLDDRVRGKAPLFEIRGGGDAPMVEDELLHRVPDCIL